MIALVVHLKELGRHHPILSLEHLLLREHHLAALVHHHTAEPEPESEPLGVLDLDEVVWKEDSLERWAVLLDLGSTQV